MKITDDTYLRLKEVVGEPAEYLNGKVCDYYQLNRIDGYFLSSLDKEYAIDYLLIKDWANFSIYRGNLIDKIIKTDLYKDIPLKTIQCVWDKFNENKKELQTSQKQYYLEKRYEFIPKLASFLLQKSKHYNVIEMLPLFKDIVENLKEEKHDYYLARNCAKLMGDYLKVCRQIDNDIFNYLKQQQDLKDMELSLVFYDWQIDKIYKNEKLECVFNLLYELKPETTYADIIIQALEKNAFHIVKYISQTYNYKFNENEIENILKKELTSFHKDNIQFVIEHFQPSSVVYEAYKQVYYEHRYSLNQAEVDSYKHNLEFLSKKVAHDSLHERLPIKEHKEKIKKI